MSERPRQSGYHRHFGEPRPGAGLARALSKLGFCSRSQGFELVRAGKVRVNGAVRRDPLWVVDLRHDRIEVEGRAVRQTTRVYLALNKPRGLVTTASDEQGRDTVFECLKGADLPVVAPVGRLDKASEGLLLLTNDTHWAARITDPDSGLEKVYHVQVDRIVDAAFLRRVEQGGQSDGEILKAARASLLRTGPRNSWLEIRLSEGKNRHIRRLLAALETIVLRLVRVGIGELQLGNLPKGRFRHLTESEVRMLAAAGKEGKIVRLPKTAVR